MLWRLSLQRRGIQKWMSATIGKSRKCSPRNWRNLARFSFFFFFLILVLSWLFEGIDGSNLAENLSVSCQFWDWPIKEPYLAGRYGKSWVGVKGTGKIFEDNVLWVPPPPVSCMITNEIPISGQCFDDGLVGGCSGGGPGVLCFWPWGCCSCKATTLMDFCLWPCGLFLTERQFR